MGEGYIMDQETKGVKNCLRILVSSVDFLQKAVASHLRDFFRETKGGKCDEIIAVLRGKECPGGEKAREGLLVCLKIFAAHLKINHMIHPLATLKTLI